MVVRLAFLAFFIQTTDLAGDEAYYWDWGRRPDWGYYSKPPLIGWLMALVSSVSGGGSEWALRGMALLLGTASLVVLHALVRQLFDARAALLAVLLVVLTPANAALNIFLTIDAPLVLLWTSALLLFWRAIDRPEALARWLVLGVVVGLGVLSKQMMLVFPLLMVIFALVSGSDRLLFKRFGFWLSMSLGILALTPVLWWNQRHQWITLEHTKHHFNADAQSLWEHVGEFVQFPLIQALLYTPVIWGLIMVLMWKLWQNRRSLPRPVLLLAAFSALPLAPFFLLALRQEVNPNWPAVFYIGLFALLAAWMTGAFFGGIRPVWRQRVLVVGAVFVGLTYLLPVVISAAGWQGKKGVDVFVDLRGWREAGRQVGQILSDCPNPDKTFMVVLGHRYNAAHLAFHMPQRPQMYRWERDGRVMSQYEVWPAPTELVGWDALVIYPDSDSGQPRHSLSTHFTKYFQSHRTVGEVGVEIGNGRNYTAQAVLCSGMKRWPPPAPPPVAIKEREVGS